MAGTTVVGTRLHWQSHTQHERIDMDRLLRQLREFCARAATYADGGILIAVGLPAATGAMITGATPASASDTADSISPASSNPTSAFIDSVRELMTKLQHEAATGAIAGKVEIIPMLYWGKFVPALNALVGTAADRYPDADTLLLQSLEIEVDATRCYPDPGVKWLDVAVEYASAVEFAAIDQGRLALMGDALRLQVEGVGPAGGDEEVSTISMYQQLFTNTPAPTRAKLIRVPNVVWQVADLKDPERLAWHTMKMRSKKQ